MVRRYIKIISKLILPIFTLSLSLTGCSAVLFSGGAAAGVGAYKYIEGEMRANFNSSIRNVSKVTLKVVNNMGFSLSEHKIDDLSGVIKAKTANNTDVIIKMSRIDNDTTKIQVRVGLWGNREESRLIMEKIKAKL